MMASIDLPEDREIHLVIQCARDIGDAIARCQDFTDTPVELFTAPGANHSELLERISARMEVVKSWSFLVVVDTRHPETECVECG